MAFSTTASLNPQIQSFFIDKHRHSFYTCALQMNDREAAGNNAGIREEVNSGALRARQRYD
jgi:hypothetical protein